MKKLLYKVKTTIQDRSLPHPEQAPSPPPIRDSTITPPTSADVFRYRYHHGTNLGSIFCLEQWLSPTLYLPGATGTELSAVKASIDVHGVIHTTQTWSSHWSNALSESDLGWLANTAHCTSIRLPIGYYCLGRDFCLGTPFESVKEVYAGAWEAVKSFVERAKQWDIGVLLDLHALPGGANSDAHGGSVTGKAEFWGRNGKKNRALGTRACVFVAQEVKRCPSLEGVIGLQIVNEAAWGAGNQGMYEWYDEVIERMSHVIQDLPIYVSDAWDVDQCLEWSSKRKIGNPVVIDTHKYYTFSEADRNQAPGQIIRRISGELGEPENRKGDVANKGPCEVIVGEYSCVMDGKTWSKVRPEDREGLVKQFGEAQSQRWQKAAGGAYFWTLQDGMGDWSFIQQTNLGNIVAPQWLGMSTSDVKERSQNAQNRAQVLLSSASASHRDYWSKTCPGRTFEHERYAAGWQVGFSDALSFFIMRATRFGLGSKNEECGGDKVGFLELWVKKRLMQSAQVGPFVWEWEQGMRAGISGFELEVGI